ncbi:MAG: hypothetical protein UMR38_08275 [Candidatus Izemoplasma sp.]|nr:hypothetical protein [Candidatus Izemoplasma sp.]
MMFLWFIILAVLLYLFLGGTINFHQMKEHKTKNHLDERLAKGEISIEEYKDIKRTLKEE